jgi:hypothetical protein
MFLIGSVFIFIFIFIFICDLTVRAALPMIHVVSVWTKLQKFCPYNRVFGVPSRDEDVYL